MHRIVGAFALSGCLALAACGGGGGGDSESTSGGFGRDESGKDNNGTSANSNSYPVSAAFASFYAKASTYELSADADGTVFTLTHSYTPRPEAVEPGLSPSPLKSFRIDETLAVDGTAEFAGASVVYFSSEPFQLWGDREAAPEGESEEAQYPFTQALSRSPAPASAKIGESRELGKWSYSYLDENNAERQQTTTVSWSLEDADNANAWLCLLQKEEDEQGEYVHKSCNQIDQTGATVDYKVDFVFPTGTINFRRSGS